MICQADAIRLPFADQTFDLVIGSPPYCDARTYGIGAQRNAVEWVDWMLIVTAEALRVSKGLVVWVAAGVTRDRTYWPACEGLMWEWFRRGGSAYRPCYWHRVGIPGSGGDDWYRFDVEYVMAFKRSGPLPYGNPLANGHKPVYSPGGPLSHRNKDGARRDCWGGMPHKMTTRRGRDGKRYNNGSSAGVVDVAIANPGNLLATGAAGGGSLGNPLAHLNEAPYPEAVPRFFIRSHCPPGGLVYDPFGGSGTTAAAAVLEGRRYVTSDIRRSQCELARRRIGDPDRYGVVDNPSLAGTRGPAPLPGQLDLFAGEEQPA